MWGATEAKAKKKKTALRERPPKMLPWNCNAMNVMYRWYFWVSWKCGKPPLHITTGYLSFAFTFQPFHLTVENSCSFRLQIRFFYCLCPNNSISHSREAVVTVLKRCQGDTAEQAIWAPWWQVAFWKKMCLKENLSERKGAFFHLASCRLQHTEKSSTTN